ncbi:hypothetical protein HGRIS_002556 [Hohenbuehelia grisea]|uniref:Carboxylic ester hydrolase n=1 Tax=Hohenbuehelia grisea TaxID=104357 RepID=A0ABR3JM84_9AGAR
MFASVALFFKVACLIGLHSSLVIASTSRGRATDIAPIVDLGYAKYQGVHNGTADVTSYLGIRYAAPPTGPLRWKHPQFPAKVPGVQSADRQPVQCFQTPDFLGGRASSNSLRNFTSKRDTEPESTEDCLFLNVYHPGSKVPSKKLPVVVWIHGGGYMWGNATGYHGEDLLQESGNDIVAVVIQYRLGVFGFLAGSEVKSNGVLNAGLLDQEFALRWVNKHIDIFGGDSEKVTIWGQSAGAGSVLQHIVANNGRTKPQLFRGAMTSSTFLPSQYAFNDVVPEGLYRQVLTLTNCSSALNALDCLRNTDTAVLQSANVEIALGGLFGTYIWAPVVDGTFITQRPTEALKQGKVNGRRFYGVTNTREGDLTINQTVAAALGVAGYTLQLFPHFKEEQAAATAKVYSKLGSALNQIQTISAESVFVCPTYFLLEAFSNKGFKGEFAIPPGHHADDVDFYFPSRGTRTYNNTDFIAAFDDSFFNFIKFLDLNARPTQHDITPRWATYSDARRTEMLFNETSAGAPRIRPIVTSTSLLERCQFWEGVSAVTGQ